MRGNWIKAPTSNVSAIFVHGILSSGESCWTNQRSGCYWPELLLSEPGLERIGIYVFTYQTSFFSGSYSLSDVVDSLKEHMRLDGVLEADRLIFVCHSMGGIVARKYIVERVAELIEAQKSIGMFLIASPSLGADYADWLSPLARFLGNSEADALRFVRGNEWLANLNKEFKNIKESGRLSMQGKELIEDKFIILSKFLRKQVVEPFAGACFFGESYKVPASDHFSIAKPEGKEAIQHRLLCEFIRSVVANGSEEYAAAGTFPVSDLKNFASNGNPRVSLSSLPASSELFSGREAELARLNEAWLDASVHVLTIVAWGGVGKSALINEWLGLMAQREYRGAQRVFGWSFYRQGTGESLASADQFIDAALRWFGDPEPRVGSPRDKGIRLAELVRSASTLLVLDGLEPLQHPPGPNSGSIRDEALAVLIRELAAQNRGLCVITTRESVADIAARQGRTATNIALNHLPPETGARLLRALGARGSENELKTASVDYQGHALALTLLGTYIRDVWSGDIRRRSEFELVSGSPEESKDARRMLSSYEAWFRQNGHDSEVAVLLLLGFFDRPASPEELDCLRDADNLGWLSKAVHELSDEEFRQVCARLRKARLLSPEVPMDKTIDAHPLVREYCARRLLEDNPNLWRAGHERLYEFLINSSKMLPDTLEEMLPLYAAVRHGCAAERYDDALFQVYWKRIQRKNEFYSLKVLGAIGADIAALANFFERLWDKPLERISPKGQSLLLDEAGESLHVLGRVSDAVKPMKLLLRRGLDSKNLKDAVRGAITLSELSLTMGKIEEAVSFGCDGVKYADEKRGNFHRQVSRSTLADALHQSGKFAEAERWFAEAEEIEKQRKPERGILSSMQGYAYCELLLGLGRFEEVERRSENAMRFAQSERSLLAIALSGLALGRAQLCRAVRDGIYDHSKTAAELEMAIDGFHRAGAEFQLPRVLLARAELRRIDGQLTDARRDISEAQEIAARGEMKLHQADCMLESVRISIAAGKMDEAKDALMVAERMVGETGYGRRISALNYLHDEIGNRPS